MCNFVGETLFVDSADLFEENDRVAFEAALLVVNFNVRG